MRTHRESIQIRTQSCSKDRMNIARRQIFGSLKMRAHRESFQIRTQLCSKDRMNIARRSIISEFNDARTQKFSSELNTVVIKAEIHAENTDAQHIVHFEEAQDSSDTGSLITTATVHTRHDQRAIVVGVCDTTKRIMVPGRVDRRLPHRISGRPRGGRQCHITTKL